MKNAVKSVLGILVFLCVLSGCSDDVSSHVSEKRSSRFGDTSVDEEKLPNNETLEAPTGTTARGISESSIEVSWNPVEGATGYRLYCGEEAGDKNPTIAIRVSGNSYIDDNGLLPLSSYYYKVSALNNSGEGPASPVFSGTTYSSGSGSNADGSSPSNAILIPIIYENAEYNIELSSGDFFFPENLDAMWFRLTFNGRGSIDIASYSNRPQTYTGIVVMDVYDSRLNIISVGGIPQADIDTYIHTSWSGTYYVKVKPKDGLSSNKGTFRILFWEYD